MTADHARLLHLVRALYERIIGQLAAETGRLMMHQLPISDAR